jgi:hypothetical protein
VDRRLQIALAIFFAIFIFAILVLPQIDLPDSTRPSRSLAGIVISFIAVFAMMSFTVLHFALLLHPPEREPYFQQAHLYEGLISGPVCAPLLC